MNDVIGGFSSDLYNQLLEITSDERIIKVMNKIDLNRTETFRADVKISAKTGEGIEELFSIMKEKAVGTQSYTEKTAIVSNLRHFDALNRAKENLQYARKSIDEKLTGEFIAVDLRNAENALSEIIGKVTTEDILNNIFTKFCVGK